ncbi:MAG TPA: GntR family transcriptional regulator [Chloroflexota bacterium]|nr:GntR family transcriptional regulator [Chloroflexota bacterium]
MAKTLEKFTPEPAQHVALWEMVAAGLRRAIILGELPDGLHLEEPALAEKFGVSRIPVREALTRLAHEGLIRLEPRRGAFVVGTTETDVHEIYEVRALIETYALRRTANTIDQAGIAQLQRYADQMAKALADHNLDRFSEPDVNFHREIVVLAQNRRLLAAWEPIGGLIAAILSITDTTYRDMPRSVESHRAIIRALQSHDAPTAEAELRAHLANGQHVLDQAMRHTHGE